MLRDVYGEGWAQLHTLDEPAESVGILLAIRYVAVRVLADPGAVQGMPLMDAPPPVGTVDEDNGVNIFSMDDTALRLGRMRQADFNVATRGRRSSASRCCWIPRCWSSSAT